MSRPPLRIAFCAANDIGSRVIERVVKDRFPIAFIATCADDSARYEEMIANAADAHNIPLLRHANPNSPEFIDVIKAQEIDIMILAWWPGIIKAAAIAAARIGWLNMHPSLLPLGRGKHPYYWSMVEGVPHGVSLHFIDAGIDTGPILFQREVPIEMTDTGEDVYRRSNEALFELFLQHYADVATGNFTAQPQDSEKATFHWGRELEPHSRIELERSYRAIDLINILRARSFSNGSAAQFELHGERFEARIAIKKVT